MATTIGKFSDIPQDIKDKQLNVEQNFAQKKEKIKKETQRNITKEEFNNMSWDNLKDNIKVTQEGTLSLFNKPIKYWLREYIWSSEQLKGYKDYKEEYLKKQKIILEKLKTKSKQLSLLSDIIDIWKSQAVKIVSSIWFKGLREDDNNILKNLEIINKEFLELISLSFKGNLNIENNNKEFNDKIKKIFQLMKNSEGEESIIGSDDLEDIEKKFFNNKLKEEEKEIQVLNLMRYGGLSGNSEGVKDVVADKILERDNRFADINVFLNNPKLEEILGTYIGFGKKDSIELIDEFGGFGEDYSDNSDDLLEKLSNLKIGDKKLGKKLAFKLIKTKTQIEEKIARGIKEEWKRYNKEIKSKGGKEIEYSVYLNKINKQRKQETIKAIRDVYKHILIRQKIESFDYRGKEDENLIGLYANLTGLGETSFSDYTTIADNHIDLAIDFATTLAIGAITMGAGIGTTVLARGAISGLRLVSLGNKALKLVRLEKYFEIGTKTRFISSFIGNATLDGVAFYEGATIMQNLMFRDIFNANGEFSWGELFKGTSDKNEIIKSIAFMGALNSLQFVSKIPGMKKLENLKFGEKIPKEYLDKRVIQKILINTGNFAIKGVKEGTIMFTISGIIEEALGNGWNPSIEEYLHFVALIQLMHLKDNFKIKEK